MPSWSGSLDAPYRTLAAAFVAWKSLLLVIAASSPGPGYDTSTSLIHAGVPTDRPQWPGLSHLTAKLTRWDAIYFVKTANRGYLHEQEWAFGWGFSRLIALCTAGLVKVGVPAHEDLEALVATCIAHLSHLLSVLVLYKLSRTLFPAVNKKRLALTTSLLHVISPAGLFLSAPYAESSCALLSFLGCLLFTQSFRCQKQASTSHDARILAAGIVFGIATTFRSNGLLNGLLFLEEALRLLANLWHTFRLAIIRRLLFTGLGGIMVAIGFILPQYIAYQEFCSQDESTVSRPWCRKTIPSIYTFVQEHYWNVGFLRYWTVSNIPLFLLATPMLGIMTKSGLWALVGRLPESPTTAGKPTLIKGPRADENEVPTKALVRNMAASQLMLTMLTLAAAHVQIITRISSASPVWMWYVGQAATSSKVKTDYFVRFMVMYAVIQGVLFSSFLPPA